MCNSAGYLAPTGVLPLVVLLLRPGGVFGRTAPIDRGIDVRFSFVPGWREYMFEGKPYYYHPERGDLTQWDPPPGWHVVHTQGAVANFTQAHASALPLLPAQQSMLSATNGPAGSSVGSVSAGSVGSATTGKPAKARKPHTCKLCGQPKKGHSCPVVTGVQRFVLSPNTFEQVLPNVPYPEYPVMQEWTQDKRQCLELHWPPGATASAAPSYPFCAMGYPEYSRGHSYEKGPA